MTKKILFLGAAPSQIPPIEYAKSQGYYVITCDYLPENPGHKLADEYYNVSTTDKEAVLIGDDTDDVFFSSLINYGAITASSGYLKSNDTYSTLSVSVENFV